MRRKSRFLMIAAALALASFTTGCFGKFALTRKLWQWNDSLGNGFLKTVVMWAFFIIPVYEVFGLADLWVLNVIEFWGGSNPVGQMQQLPDGSIQMEKDGIVMRLVPRGENQFAMLRDGKLIGTATMTPDHGLTFKMVDSDEVVRVPASDVQRTEAAASQLQIAPAQ